MADTQAVIPASILRNLADKLYEKRKNAALEVLISLSIYLSIYVYLYRLCGLNFFSHLVIVIGIGKYKRKKSFFFLSGGRDCEAASCGWGSRAGNGCDQFIDIGIRIVTTSKSSQGTSMVEFFFVVF